MRMLGDQRLQLADQLGVAAERQVGLDPLLERRQPQILEPAALDPRERLLAELGQRRAAPQPERLAQQARRTLRLGLRAPRRPAARTASRSIVSGSTSST